MKDAAIGLVGRSLLATALGVALTSVSSASPYTATHVGELRELWMSSTLNNSTTGVSYPFAMTTRSPNVDELLNPPTVTRAYGGDSPTTVTYPMIVTEVNDAGTSIGTVPAEGGDPSNPWDARSRVFTVRSEDGGYALLVDLLPGVLASHSEMMLSQSNQILVTDFGGYTTQTQKTWLFDVNSRTSTPLEALVPAELLATYGTMIATGIDDRGNLLVHGARPGPYPDQPWSTVVDAFILTPPGQAAPSPIPPPIPPDPLQVPEPSALWIFGGVAAALGARAVVGGRGGRTDRS
ncbi:hypothetical protein [Planctomyces sp. SH-PL62]|uniref:hypothetical protein n=1 Tax=Planctomyces sp. SH-PL62 TaxID=1636152 RepID=UPI00078B3DC9|nr:hypothetical protein [Planctomyces sp. SH-PL62]AMV36128.1 hypothetical protein VT85_01700 [Planctomyces sp. SH-PL62]